MSLARGEIVAMTGRSGVGKSSVALAILGLLPAGISMTGKISWTGTEDSELALPENHLAWGALRGVRIGYIPQDVFGAFDPVVPMGRQLAATAAQRLQTSSSEVQDKIRSLMPELGLAEVDRIWSAFPHELSGGQLQRCLICLAVAMKPALLITDEPTSAIDRIHQFDILTLLRRVVSRFDIAVLCITHEHAWVRSLADREIRLGTSAQVNALLSGQALTGQSLQLRELVLEAKALTFTHRTSRAQDGPGMVIGPVSFQLHRGSCLGIIGMSGSGKSTLAQMLVGWHAAQAGVLRWRDLKVDLSAPEALRQLRAHVQLVLQDSRGALHPYLTIRQLFEETGALRGKDERRHPGRWAEALSAVGLRDDVLERRSAALSGGECLRVAIARALLLEPDVLICDESTSALDPETRDGILDLLDRLKQARGLALVFITHDETVIGRLADQVLVMAEGKVVEQGAAREVIRYPTHEVSKKIFAAGATFPGLGRP